VRHPGSSSAGRRRAFPGRQSFLLSSSRAPKFRDAAASRRQSFLRCRAGSSSPLAPGSSMCQSFRISHGPGVPGFAVRIRALPPIPVPSPPSPPGENPVKTRRGPWEGPAKARFAPGASRGGPGAASRALKAPGPCPGTPPAFRGQKGGPEGSSCPLKVGRRGFRGEAARSHPPSLPERIPEERGVGELWCVWGLWGRSVAHGRTSGKCIAGKFPGVP
jgi:hypothetical protein